MQGYDRDRDREDDEPPPRHRTQDFLIMFNLVTLLLGIIVFAYALWVKNNFTDGKPVFFFFSCWFLINPNKQRLVNGCFPTSGLGGNFWGVANVYDFVPWMLRCKEKQKVLLMLVLGGGNYSFGVSNSHDCGDVQLRWRIPSVG